MKKKSFLTKGQCTRIAWWLITFQTRKVTAYYYYNNVLGMADVIAYRKAKRVTKSDYKFMMDDIKIRQKAALSKPNIENKPNAQ